ncbi:MAG: hypothetical protein ABFR50_06635 [Candidatus Fermentibacteria bacterium]
MSRSSRYSLKPGGIDHRVVERLKQARDDLIARGVKYDTRHFWEALGFMHKCSAKDWTWTRTC